MDMSKPDRGVSRGRRIVRVTLVGVAANLVLTAGKIVAGIAGRSAAMVSDGAHSLSDLVSDVTVLVFVRISSKGKDKGHDFGHGKFETLATLMVGALLAVVGVKLLLDGIEGIYAFVQGESIAAPGSIALWAAVISIVSKEILYRYTVKAGKAAESPVVVANAWHHRSDALSSVGSLLGIGGAILLGERWTFLDPLASCVISIVLVFSAVRIFLPATRELLDVSLPDEMESEIVAVAESVPGVLDLHELKTMREGPYIIIEAHVTVDRNITVVQAHDIASAVEEALTARFGGDTQLSIHIEPSEVR